MKISIALCTYNSEKYLPEQLNSFLSQIRPPDEVLVCDDASKDQTVNILKKFQATAPFTVKIVENERNLGFNKNFEKAISLCTGEVIFISDSDDIWLPEKIARVLHQFQNNPKTQLVFSNEFLCDVSGKQLPQTFWQLNNFSEAEKKLFDLPLGYQILLRKTLAPGHTMAFRTELRQKILPFGTNWVFDAWILWIAKLSSEIKIISEPLVLYRQHGEQNIGLLSANRWQRLWERFNRAKRFKREDYLKLSKQSEELFQRACALNIPEQKALALLQQRADFYHSKFYYPAMPLLRIPYIVKNLLLGNYSKFENGATSAIKDCFLIG